MSPDIPRSSRTDDPNADATLTYVAPQAPADPAGSVPHTLVTVDGVTLAPWTVAEAAPDADAEAPPSGSEEASRYELRKVVARGGMGEVWEALQVSLGRVVAVKRIRQDRISKAGDSHPERTRQLAEFHHEAAVTAWLEHPNIIPVHDLGKNETGEPLLAMKLVHGRPWQELLDEERKSLPFDEYLARHVAILVDVTQAVAFAHSRGIIHRDLKPTQVMIGEFGETLLMDWGLALKVSLGEETSSHTPLTNKLTLPDNSTASSPAGTPALMAPEQTEPHARGVGIWTDVYLLGGTLYYILTGSFPHAAANVHEAMIRAQRGIVEDPRKKAPGVSVPESLAELCNASMRPSPAERLQTAKEFLASLEDYLSGASRKRESLAIVEEVRVLLRQAEGDYRVLSDVEARLSRAASLWPENPHIAALRDDAFEEHARAAITNSDLVLASVLADRIVNDGRRRSLLAAVEREEERIRALARTRRLAMGGAFALLALLFLGAGAFAIHLNRARKLEAELRTASERSAERATEARAQSEGLVGYMLQELPRRLAPTKQLDLLDDTADQADEYYRKRAEADALSREEWIEILRGYSSVIKLWHQMQNAERTQKALAEWESLLRRVPPEVRDDIEVRDMRGALGQTIARIHLNTGDLDGVRRVIEEMRVVSAPLLDDPKYTSRARASIAFPICFLAREHSRRGNREEAKALMAEARQLIAPILANPAHLHTVLPLTLLMTNYQVEELTGDGKLKEALEEAERGIKAYHDYVTPALSEDATLSATLVSIVVQRGNLRFSFLDAAGAAEDAREGARMVRVLQAMRPENLNSVSASASTMEHSAALLLKVGDEQAAIEMREEAIRMLKEVVERAPDAVQPRFMLSVFLSNLATLHRTRQSYDVAEALFMESKENLEILLKTDPTRREWLRASAVLGNTLASVYNGRGDFQRALDSVLRGREWLQILLAQDPDTVSLRSDLISSYSWETGVRWSLGQADQAIAVGMQSIEEARRLKAEQPENPNWIQIETQLGTNIIGYLRNVRRLPEALELTEQLLAQQLQILAKDPTIPATRRNVSSLMSSRGEILLFESRIDEALQQLERLEQFAWESINRGTEVTSREGLAYLFAAANQQYMGLLTDGRPDEALALIELHRPYLLPQLPALDFASGGFNSREAYLLNNSRALRMSDRVEEAEPWCQSAAQITANPSEGEALLIFRQANILEESFLLQDRAGLYCRVQGQLTALRKLVEEHMQRYPQTQSRNLLQTSLRIEAQSLLHSGNPELALPLLERAEAISAGYLEAAPNLQDWQNLIRFALDQASAHQLFGDWGQCLAAAERCLSHTGELLQLRANQETNTLVWSAAQNLVIRALLKLRRQDEAQARLKTLLEQAKTYQKNVRLEEGQATFAVRMMLAEALVAQAIGDRSTMGSKARAALEALSDQPEKHGNLLAMAELHQLLGEDAAAQTLIQRVIETTEYRGHPLVYESPSSP